MCEDAFIDCVSPYKVYNSTNCHHNGTHYSNSKNRVYEINGIETGRI